MDGTMENNQALQNLRGQIYVIPQVDETLSKKGYSADAKKTGEALEERVKKTDIVDGLTSDATDKPVSANAARLLKEQLDKFNLSQAASVGYSNTASGLQSTNMQGAIDEVAQKIKNADDSLSNFENDLENLLPKTGGMITGSISVQNAENGYGQVMKNNSASADYGTMMADVSKAGKTAKINVNASLDLLTYTDPSGQIRDILHEGNKPFGSYIGNGSAVSRMIDTKGIGRLAIVYNKDNFSFVTPQGALSVDTSDGSIEWIAGTKAYFLNGTLGITTASEAFNIADKEYYYQVI